jgi:hypothetical protein
MLSRRSLVIAALLLIGFHQPSIAKEANYYDSLRLVNAMREDELMLLAVRAAKALRNEPVEQDAKCFDRYQYPELTDIPARQISEQMTDSEVADALRYFQSDAGRSFVRRNELALIGKVAGAPGLSTAEHVELERFKRRSAGRKLLGKLITRQPKSMAEAISRVNQHLDHCTYLRHTEAERQGSPASCKSKMVASQDNVCLASYAALGNAAKPDSATVDVSCRHHGRMLTTQIDLAPEFRVALRWSKSRELEILVEAKNVRFNQPNRGDLIQRFRMDLRKPNDPPVLDCLPVSPDYPTLAEVLPLSTTVAAWRTYRAPGLCMMTARVPKEDVPGADGDMLLQFRQQKRAALPFATSRLALVVQIYQSGNERPLLIDAGKDRLAMIEHAPQMTHLLTGKPAETLLQGLKTKPAELTVAPEGAASYPIPIRRQDFDFAYRDFSECLTGLKAT